MGLIIGIGHKARQGKDIFAEFFYNEIPEDCFITHWADPLKEEVKNKERELPLIYTKITDDTYYALLNKSKEHYFYEVKKADEVPYLHEIFTKRNIDYYMGMDEKDSEMLQFWGTNYRRNADPDYWVNKTYENIKFNAEKYILIPDTRFKNEYNKIKDLGGIYIDMIRMENGKQFIDSNRDPNHPSEIELDNLEHIEYKCVAETGDLESIKNYAKSIIDTF